MVLFLCHTGYRSNNVIIDLVDVCLAEGEPCNLLERDYQIPAYPFPVGLYFLFGVSNCHCETVRCLKADPVLEVALFLFIPRLEFPSP